MLQDGQRVLEAGDRAFTHAGCRPGHLAQPSNAAPEIEAFGPMALELREGAHEAAEAALLEGRDRDEWVTRADEDVELAHEPVDGQGGWVRH